MNISSLIDPNPSSLAERYRIIDSEVCELFGSHPSIETDWERRAFQLDQQASHRANPQQLADVLRSFQKQLPYHPQAEASLGKLEKSDCFVIVGGQQAGLFGGAMLIYYKALTVIQAARHAEKQLGRPVVPIFWIAGEDHDYDEANHVYIQSAGNGIQRIRIDRPEGPRMAVSRTEITSKQWVGALQELAEQLPDSEFKPVLLKRLESYVSDSPTLSLAFARMLADLFGKEGLVILDADDPYLRALEAPMFKELIQRNDELEEVLKIGEANVAAKGFKLQAESAAGGANLFLHHEMGRLLLHKEQDNFVDRRGYIKLSKQDLLELATVKPDLLSTNALTRPLMQDYVLPVLGAVVGPSELAYWANLRPAFEAFGMSMPLLLLRQGFLYLEPSIAKLLNKFALSPQEAVHEWESRKSSWLQAQEDWGLEGKFRLAKQQFLGSYKPILDTLTSVQPGLSRLAVANQDRIIGQMEYLEARSQEAFAKQHEATLNQWDRIHQSLTPLDKPQERVYGLVHFWNRYGPQWLDQWLHIPYEVTGGQRLISKITG